MYHPSQISFDFAKKGMEAILSKFAIAKDPDWSNVHHFIIPKNYTSLIGRGANTLVFELPEKETQGERNRFVGRLFGYSDNPTLGVPDGFYHSNPKRSGLIPFGLETTLYWIEKAGISNQDIIIPSIKEFSERFGPKYAEFTIMPDLRGNNQFQIEDAQGFDYSRLQNGSQLNAAFDRSCEQIEQFCNTNNLVIMPAGHGSEEDPTPAVEHMFLVQYIERGLGKIIVADLNHLAIKRRNDLIGIKPEYLS